MIWEGVREWLAVLSEETWGIFFWQYLSGPVGKQTGYFGEQVRHELQSCLPGINKQGPVVQNLTKLSAIVKISILKYGKYIDIFCWKNVSNYSNFCSKNINVFENTLAATVNTFAINKLVKLTMLWTTEPWSI